MKATRVLIMAVTSLVLVAADLNGFIVTRHTVPRSSIVAGGPRRDAIQSVDKPGFVTPEKVTWARPGDAVIGVAVEGAAHAYPVHLLEWHQVVNDVIAGVPVLVTYDPLTGSPSAFRRDVAGRVLEFGVSGLVYNSGGLIYDRQTESLWSPFRAEAVSGELGGTKLTRVRVRNETFSGWLERHPRTVVLERPQLKKIDYRYSPYVDYWVDDRIPFAVEAKDRRFHAKEVVFGVVVKGKARAYLGSLVTAAGGSVRDEFEGKTISLEYHSNEAVFRWAVPEDVVATESYWFAWKAFHPNTDIWNDPGSDMQWAPQE